MNLERKFKESFQIINKKNFKYTTIGIQKIIATILKIIATFKKIIATTQKNAATFQKFIATIQKFYNK